MENHAKRTFDITTLCTFASPRVGTMEFVHTFNRFPIESWRIFNKWDIVTKIPLHIPVLADYGQVDTSYELNSSGFAENNPVCWHILETCLHGINPAYPLRPECVRKP